MATPVVSWIIKANIVVFFLWYVFFALGWSSVMLKDFLVSWSLLSEGRVWTLITSVFSHNLLFHIFINMFVLYGFGRVMEVSLGSRKFFLFYIIAGMAGSIGHCLVSLLLLDQPNLAALGASGAISGILVLFALMYPHEKIFILGIFPLPAFWAVFLFVALDLHGLFAQSRGSELPIGYGAHLGGALAGLIYFFYHRSHDRERRYRMLRS